MSERYYAILGRSYLGLTNASTLLKTGQRLDGRKIILIGEESPWHRYADHEMGQPACFLALPGFQSLPSNPASRDLMRSGEFSRILREQEVFLKSHVEIRNALVNAIDSPADGEVDGEYVLSLNTGEQVAAERIDFCTGPGLPRVLERGEAADPENLLPLWIASAWNRLATTCPALLSADQYLCEPPRQIRTVGVLGRGGVASQCADLALLRGADRIVWMDPPRGTTIPQLTIDAILPTEMRSRLQAGSDRIENRVGQLVVFTISFDQIEAKIGNERLALDCLIVARGPIPEESQIPSEWKHLQPPGSFLAEKIPSLTPMTPDSGYGRSSKCVRLLSHAEIGRDDVPYLASLWKDLPRKVPATLSIADPRLIAVQAAYIAVANGFQPVPHRVLNANTAFHEELHHLSAGAILSSRVDQPILGHPDPRIGCWYC